MPQGHLGARPTARDGCFDGHVRWVGEVVGALERRPCCSGSPGADAAVSGADAAAAPGPHAADPAAGGQSAAAADAVAERFRTAGPGLAPAAPAPDARFDYSSAGKLTALQGSGCESTVWAAGQT